MEALDNADELEAQHRRLRRGSWGGFGAGVFLGVGAAFQAWPGGLGYTLTWFLGFAAVGAVLSLPAMKKLRELKPKLDQARLTAGRD